MGIALELIMIGTSVFLNPLMDISRKSQKYLSALNFYSNGVKNYLQPDPGLFGTLRKKKNLIPLKIEDVHPYRSKEKRFVYIL